MNPTSLPVRVLPCLMLAFAAALAPAARTVEPYMRVVETPEGASQLQIAVRKFVPRTGDGPAIYLAAVIHIGEPDYYHTLQKQLDGSELVLFEGVGWPLFADHTPAADDELAERTETGIRFVATLLERYRKTAGAYPATLGLLEQATRQHHRRAADFLTMARNDNWGRPLVYKLDGDTFTLTSLGSDGKEGGDGPAADLSFADQPPLDDDELSDAAGLQTDLAHALGLTFQLDEIDYTRANFRNSDIPMATIRESFSNSREGNAQMNQLVGLLNGTSMLAGFVKFGLNLIASSPKLQSMTRLTLIEVFGQLNGDLSRMKGLPPGMETLFKKIIQDRNKIVLRDLDDALHAEHAPKSITVFYGAGHMADLEPRLRKAFHYKPAEDTWYPALTENPAAAGLTDADVQMIRGMVKLQMMQMQGEPPAGNKEK